MLYLPRLPVGTEVKADDVNMILCSIESNFRQMEEKIKCLEDKMWTKADNSYVDSMRVNQQYSFDGLIKVLENNNVIKENAIVDHYEAMAVANKLRNK